LEEYREWNHSVEVSQHKNKLFTYIYYGRDNQKFEIANLQRRLVCNLEQTKYLLVGKGFLIKNTSMKVEYIK